MGDSGHKDKELQMLRASVRERIEKGLLPRDKAARTWGGRGSGLICSLCDLSILESEPEIELEFDGAAVARALRFHLQCHSIWDSERRAPVPGSWTPTETEAPPFNVVVEARLNMGAGRTVILGVIRVRVRAGEWIWMNATTNSPLPTAWRPVEWRYAAGMEPASPAAETSAPKRA